MSWKTFYRLTGSTRWVDISFLEIAFKPRSYPTGMDEGTTAVIVNGMDFFVILRVVPSILPKIRYGGWYQNCIYTVRFLCMASRTSLEWFKVKLRLCYNIKKMFAEHSTEPDLITVWYTGWVGYYYRELCESLLLYKLGSVQERRRQVYTHRYWSLSLYTYNIQLR